MKLAINYFKLFILIKKLLLFIISVVLHNNVIAQEPQRIEGSPFPYSMQPDTIYVIYDENFSEEEVLIIQTLQGIVSKYKPAIYRDVGTGSSVWLNDLIDKGLITASYLFENNFINLLSNFKEKISGYVLCDLHSTSSNIAISISGILNAIPVTATHINLMDSLEIPLIYDVRNKDYNWVLNNFSDSLNENIIIYQDTVKDLCLGDYSAFTNSLHFFEDIHSQLVDTIFNNTRENSFLLGWGNDEYQTIKKSSGYSISVLPADYAYNLSLLTNLNSTISQKNHEIKTKKIDSVHTVCFVMSDGDNLQWLLNWFITDNRWFGNNNRGQIDIGWTISPALSELAPTVMNKIYETASDTEFGKDYFIAGPSGTGYIYPESFVELESYTNQLNKYMQKSDLNIINIIGNNFDDLYLHSFVEKQNIQAIFYYDFSNYSNHNGEIKFLNNKPIISARYNLWGGFNNTKSLSQKINNLPKDPYSPSGYSLIPVHNWSNSVDSILLCSQLFTENIRIVSPDKFINLIKENLNNKYKNEIPFISYPKPVSSVYNIELREKSENILSIELYDIGGANQRIDNALIKKISDNLTKIQINISQLNGAMYFLKIELIDQNIIIDKIIKN
tara:strand:- start:1624 stop:3471 length:1848 start_codon:yes stop_codon:yes gene_type:complete